MSYSVFSTTTVAGAVAEATLVAQNRDREAKKASAMQKKSMLDTLRDWTKAAIGGRFDASAGSGRSA